jgi:hypothetical protein
MAEVMEASREIFTAALVALAFCMGVVLARWRK